jgi:hypothetical protein
MQRAVIAMKKTFAFAVAVAVAAALGLGGAIGAFALLVGKPADHSGSASNAPRPVWTEIQWPFPTDQWGRGKAFRCKPADCGSEVSLYLRAKIGFCNCTTGVADDEDLDRMSDFDLVGGEILPLRPGRPVAVGSMKGRSRAYTLAARNPPGKTVISVVYNDRCDMIAATTVLPHDRPAAIEPDVIAFLNSATVVRWAEVTLGI